MATRAPISVREGCTNSPLSSMRIKSSVNKPLEKSCSLGLPKTTTGLDGMRRYYEAWMDTTHAHRMSQHSLPLVKLSRQCKEMMIPSWQAYPRSSYETGYFPHQQYSCGRLSARRFLRKCPLKMRTQALFLFEELLQKRSSGHYVDWEERPVEPLFSQNNPVRWNAAPHLLPATVI